MFTANSIPDFRFFKDFCKFCNFSSSVFFYYIFSFLFDLDSAFDLELSGAFTIRTTPNLAFKETVN